LRGLKLTATLLMILLASCAPALAHTPNAAAQQYSASPSALEVGDVVRAAADAAARGTWALNGALSEDKSSSAAAATISGGDQPDSDGKAAGLAELPATGGASPLLPCAGTLLMMAGLASLLRRTLY